MARTQTRSDLSGGTGIRARQSLYSDFDLTFIANPNNKDITIKKDIAAIKQSVKNLILTHKGERPFQPYLGSTVNAIVDMDADDYVELYVKYFDGGSAASNNYYTESTTFGGFRITGV